MRRLGISRFAEYLENVSGPETPESLESLAEAGSLRVPGAKKVAGGNLWASFI